MTDTNAPGAVTPIEEGVVLMPPPVPEGMTRHDISVESFRVYDYGNGIAYRIERPVTLFVKRKPISEGGDTHRVVDAEGVVHYPRPGWLAIKWGNTDNSVAF